MTEVLPLAKAADRVPFLAAATVNYRNASL
jgi:hypothetical protein